MVYMDEICSSCFDFYSQWMEGGLFLCPTFPDPDPKMETFKSFICDDVYIVLRVIFLG